MILAASLVVFAAGCAKQSELDDVIGRIDGIENRVSRLEDEVKKLNDQEIPGLRALVQAIQSNITITSVVETDEGFTITFSNGTVARLRNGKDGKDGQGVDGIDGVGIQSVKEVEGGYLITFTDGRSFTLYHGQPGLDGKQIGVAIVDGVYVWTVDGKVLLDPDGNPIPLTGADGLTPQVSITLIDGEYYWTVNGEVLKDDAGNPIPVAGKDGTDGVTPQFGILDGHWVVSYDNGETWKTLGLTSDTDYSAYIDPDKETDDYIVLVVGATEVQIPKEKAFTLTFTTIENNGLNAGETVAFPYVISGVNASDETDVDVIGIIDWTAEVVPTDNASGVLNVTATENATAKVTVYAANHKGKADIRTLKFEGSVLTAVIETKDIEWEGGELDLAVTANRAYHIFIPAAAEDWITVTPETKVHTDNYTITVARNETGAYRMATLQVLDQKGESVKDIEILQYANPEVATDLASVLALPEDKSLAAKGLTVVAASKASSIVTDGTTFSYVAGYTGEAGTVIDVTGTRKTDDFGLGYIAASDVKVDAEGESAEVNPKENYLYYGVGANGFEYFYTSANGVLAEKDGAYTIAGLAEPQQFVVEDPTQDLSALAGNLVAFSGWVKTVDVEADVKEDIVIVLTDIHAVTLTYEAGWAPYYGGPNSGNANYPEIVGNQVSNPQEDVFYALNVVSAADVEAYGSLDNLLVSGILEASDNTLYYLWYYGYQYSLDFDTAFGYLAYNDSEAESWSKFDYGVYYAIAAGIDKEGRLSGKYAITPFEKEDPRTPRAYEDFLGTWNVGGVEWTVSQKEAGVSYYIDGMQGASAMASRGGNVTVVGSYDATNGCLYVMEQEMAAYDDPSANNYGPLKDYLSGVFTSDEKIYPNFPTNGSAYPIFSIYGLKDGSYEMFPGACKWAEFHSFRFRWIIQTGSYAGAGNNYSTTSIPMAVMKVNKVEGKYEDFLGTWTVGEDQWTVTAKKDGETYSVAGIYGLDKLYSGSYETVEAGYDAEEGVFFIKDQYLGQFNSDEIPAFSNNPYGMCSDNLCGIFVYGSSAYSGYPNNGLTTPALILTGALDADGTVKLTPADCRYGTYAALGFSWSILTGANAGKGNYYGNYVTVLPATMVKASAGTTSVRPATTETKASVAAALSHPADQAVNTPVFTPGQEASSRPCPKARKF